jgi:hypothetical protein
MSKFRLHIDIPLGFGEAEAAEKAKTIIELLRKENMVEMSVEQINYRLGNDEDRQKSNYLEKNANGHTSNKKSRIMISEGLTSAE